MPKYYCDYCDTYLTHDSPNVRKTHISGKKHIENVTHFYQKLVDEQTQKMIDDTTAAFRAKQMATNPFAPGRAMEPVNAVPPMLMHPGGLMHPLLMGPPQIPSHMMMGPGGGVPQMTMNFNVPPPHMMMRPQAPMMAVRPGFPPKN